MEWVEVEGKTVEIAVTAALAELGLESAEEAEIEIIQQPKAGFLGIGGQPAIVKVTRRRPPRKRRRRRRRKARSGGETAKATEQRRGPTPEQRKQGGGRPAARGETPVSDTTAPAEAPDIEEQARVAREFLAGLLDSLGLEGEVATRVENDVLYVDVLGEQTEALVGPKGSGLQAALELTRTVIQRKTFGAPRIRLDIAGYTERRREALRIYARRLAEKVLAEGGEIMLEPMNAADRKVVHDTIVEIEGVRSYSEGEEPHRAVVISPEAPIAPEAEAAGREPGVGAAAEVEEGPDEEAPDRGGD